jgi:16S rRNA (guanine527-N7)-methyltransferase
VAQGSQDRGRKPFDMEVSELIDALSDSGLRMRDGAADRLVDLAGLISRWNQSINLISRKDTERLVSYHFADSVSLIPIIAPARRIRVLDVGGSNGLPGLVISSVCPGVDLLIRDGRTKRAAFLEEACAASGPGNTFEIGRVDDREFVSLSRESFDLILARAVTSLKLLLKWCLPLLKPGGVLAAYKGSRCNAEAETARKFFFARGGSLLTVVGSPLNKRYNPLRKFAIAIKGN